MPAYHFLASAAIAQTATATLAIDANQVENLLSPTLYGQFAEFMFEDIKGGLSAELIRDRGFDEQPNALGLPRYWERDPDDRNDDGALHFTWDADVYLPVDGDQNTLPSQHSLRVEIHGDVGQRRGIHQGWIPIRSGLEYHGYIWLKGADYAGDVEVTLEADQTGGEQYASATLTQITGDWKKYPFTLNLQSPIRWRKLPFCFRTRKTVGRPDFVDARRRGRRCPSRC